MILFCAYFAVRIQWVEVLQVGLKSIQKNFQNLFLCVLTVCVCFFLFVSHLILFLIIFLLKVSNGRVRESINHMIDLFSSNFECYSFFCLRFFYLIGFNQAHSELCIQTWWLYILPLYNSYFISLCTQCMTKRSVCHAKRKIQRTNINFGEKKNINIIEIQCKIIFNKLINILYSLQYYSV